MAAMTQYATGKRKSAIARAWVTAAAGDIVVNEKPLDKAFPRMTLRNVIQFPFELAGVAGKYSVRATVYGGGPAGENLPDRHHAGIVNRSQDGVIRLWPRKPKFRTNLTMEPIVPSQTFKRA